MERLQHEHKTELQQHTTMIDTLQQQITQLKSEIKRKGNEASQMLLKMTENREQPSKELLVVQTEKERLMERVEDLEGRLNRETSDYRDTINELKQEKEDLSRQLGQAEEHLQTAINENKQNDKTNSAQAAADTKLQISRIQQQFKEEK